jgi:hypothetical protein
VLHVLLVNAVTLCGLMVVYYLAVIPGLLIRHGAGDTRSLGAAS